MLKAKKIPRSISDLVYTCCRGPCSTAVAAVNKAIRMRSSSPATRVSSTQYIYISITQPRFGHRRNGSQKMVVGRTSVFLSSILAHILSEIGPLDRYVQRAREECEITITTPTDLKHIYRRLDVAVLTVPRLQKCLLIGISHLLQLGRNQPSKLLNMYSKSFGR